MPLTLGFDFDNTIVRYDQLFHSLACERGLIDEEMVANKTTIRDHLRSCGKEDEWTEMQGLAYGERIVEAQLFEGVLEIFSWAQKNGHTCFIVSHKTEFPFAGPQTNLHQAARGFIKKSGIEEAYKKSCLDFAFFETRKELKCQRIGSLHCDSFLDDLPEFLSLEEFPDIPLKILFDPAENHQAPAGMSSIQTWKELPDLLSQIEKS